jgi:ATP-binding cassette subfamily B protein
MQDVHANPVTGRILLYHATGLGAEAMLALVKGVLSTTDDDTRTFTPTSLLPWIALSGGALALHTLTPLGVPILLASGIVVATVVAVASDESFDTPETGAPHRTVGLLRLYRYSHRHRRRLVIAVTCSIISKVLHFAPPLVIGKAVDLLIRGASRTLIGFGFLSIHSQLWVLGVSIVGLWGVASLFEYVYRYQWRTLSQLVQHDLQVDAYARVQRATTAYLEERSSGALATVLNEDANQLEVFFNDGANDALQLAANVVVVGLAFIVLAPQVAWIALAPMPLVAWASTRFRSRLGPLYSAAREHASASDGHLVNNLTGITTIRSFTTEDYEETRVRELSEQYLLVSGAATRLNAAFTPSVRMIVIIGFAATVVRAGTLVVSGALTPGAYSFLVFLTQRFLWPLTILGQTIDLNQRAMAAAHRVLDLLEVPMADPGGTEKLPSAQGDIRFEGVSFAYPSGGSPVLRDFSLQVSAGQRVAFVGPTGAGKTTIIKLLLRFYEPRAGRILLDGRDIRQLATHDLRAAIGLVSQDVFLFDGTIEENIRYGSFSASDQAVRRAARSAEADGFIARLPEGYATRVGERGIKLSGGQRQRICIARAVLKSPPVLVLDEATSSVDNETEAAIQRALERVSVGRTVIMIAHRLSTVRNADRIYVMDAEGRIAEEGRHDALIVKNGFYAALWRVQTGVAVARDESEAEAEDVALSRTAR